jgi:hypothetical protein
LHRPLSDFAKSSFQYHCTPFGKNGSNSLPITGMGIMPVRSNSGAGSRSPGGIVFKPTNVRRSSGARARTAVREVEHRPFNPDRRTDAATHGASFLFGRCTQCRQASTRRT